MIFGEFIIYFIGGFEFIYLKIGDLNNDNIFDVVIGNGELDNVFIFLGKGNGIFEVVICILVGDGFIGVNIGDFNKDGFNDIVVSNFDEDIVLVFLVDGMGSFLIF